MKTDAFGLLRNALYPGFGILAFASALSCAPFSGDCAGYPAEYNLQILYGTVLNYTENDGQWLNVYQAEALFVFLFAKIQPFKAAGIDYRRTIAQDLVLVDMAQGNIVKSWIGNVTWQ